MSSGTKHCALGVHCFIFKFRIRIRDRTRVDWTEIQDSDEKTKVTTLLLKAERGAGDTLLAEDCLLYTSPSPRDRQKSRMPSSA